MTTKKWLLLIALGIAALFAIVVTIGIVGFVGLNYIGVDHSLPVYTSDQIPSAHTGYRRTTVTDGTSVYVNDFEEYALQLINYDPTNAIGRTAFGNGKICAITGQEPSAYIAVDVGSEMPAYAAYRNSQIPPFDWRRVSFQEIEFTWPSGSGAYKRTNDLELIEDVVRTLRDGTPVSLAAPLSFTNHNLAKLRLFSDQLPGLSYCPEVYLDEAGPVYLAENMVIETTNRQSWVKASWIPASPLLTQWMKTP